MSPNKSHFDFDAESTSDTQLERLIAQWAAKHRLSFNQAEAIRRNIFASTSVLPFDWWWKLFQSVGLVKSEYDITSVGLAYAINVLSKTLKEVIPGRPCDSDNFIPYLNPVTGIPPVSA